MMTFQVPSIIIMGVDMNKMNRSLGRVMSSEMDDFGGSNVCGVFRYRA